MSDRDGVPSQRLEERAGDREGDVVGTVLREQEAQRLGMEDVQRRTAEELLFATEQALDPKCAFLRDQVRGSEDDHAVICHHPRHLPEKRRQVGEMMKNLGCEDRIELAALEETARELAVDDVEPVFLAGHPARDRGRVDPATRQPCSRQTARKLPMPQPMSRTEPGAWVCGVAEPRRPRGTRVRAACASRSPRRTRNPRRSSTFSSSRAGASAAIRDAPRQRGHFW